MITLQAQGVNGFTAHEVFKKTLGATNIKYTKDGAEETVALAKGINDVDRSYGEDANGAKVLRFTLTFEYPEELFAHGVQSVVVQTPGKKNATDSYVGVPQSLFVQKANDIKETQ
jgi:hypothetical protein